MSLTQNEKIRQVTETTIIVGIDIASETHYARTFDWRGIEYGTVFSFENDEAGFKSFSKKIAERMRQEHKTEAIVGAEPTGHYWFALAVYLKEQGYKLVLVNPYHVKKAKELDDNHPSKTDRKDPKTIAKLVIEGRYIEPYIPVGIYAELRITMNCRWRINRELTSIKNQIQRWLKIYFPEYGKVFGKFDVISSLAILRAAPLPSEVVTLKADGVNAIWRKQKIRAVGQKRAAKLYDVALRSIGCTEGSTSAKMELQILLDDYDSKMRHYEAIMTVVAALCEQLPEVTELLKIKGIGLVTVAGFIAEIGDIRRFESPRQIQKLAGLGIKENSSGKHKGQTGISKRGRTMLRTILFRAAIVLAAKNPEFQSIHNYFTTREHNPLKRKQSIIAMSCKLIRVIYAVVTKGQAYDPNKMLTDIHRNTLSKAA
jgi:transposase